MNKRGNKKDPVRGPNTVTRRTKLAVGLPDGLDDPARQERANFEAKYKAFIKQVQKVSLSILVWGPNPGSESPAAVKRNEIRQDLINLGHNAMFSEDLHVSTRNVSEKTKELAQACAADLIIILVDSPGAIAEFEGLCDRPEIAPNVYAMIHKKYKRRGYIANGAVEDLSNGYGGVYWYGDEDLELSNVRKQAVKRTEARRCILFRSRGMTG
jgi:hypothetical protein